MFDAVNSFELSSAFENSTNEKVNKLLLVEDDPDLNSQLSALLSSQQYEVTSYESGSKALECLKTHSFDLIILDVDLPDVDGFELLNYVREHSSTPVVMLTAYGAEEHRIRGLRFGADDYVSKPCSFTELCLRIEGILRRTQSPGKPISSTSKLAHEELVLNKYTQIVTVNANDEPTDVQLTPIQFKLLWTLAQNKGHVQSKPYLYQAVLDRDFCQYDRSLDMHLSRIRKKLVAEGMPTSRIKTVHGKGYLFV
ncbi:transcriptional regulatory protein CpxR [Vibrio nigripulchritudo ATCC 27043]|uniref:TWO-COMPONENT SYSTEM SENSOR HISTIDINE KINASE/RESPONSE REGULATOR n=1 Tax=Vibrio nigripulchritudo SOn1 TaxID=1238450 RepID=A0AAV2VZF9_9VIBR|nr:MULTISPECIES: response regulator transcription factor [Vibrio]EGU61268.1 transcriptional regulatory protein CpxR [Vibrio nigripulchritudo ATCC 27043]KJY67899.1 transcriptional regulator [Vibrio nigripulchritudo]UAB72173.1 response regulator transcription factor [Vibrio sp. SCSIO 43132]CCN70814.1 putative TWO-COMPONENT SYSTEM SENSOR HISTIDINE KINASE/RESPONSE REGULATOR [Vibrio nigripulchritudo SFn118]CCO49870.1 putative TWO-COMPONENT SYSTEM SENSOR HISTIDINE KINASE/RESPONSE REGULATOR [Vibrio n